MEEEEKRPGSELFILLNLLLTKIYYSVILLRIRKGVGSMKLENRWLIVVLCGTLLGGLSLGPLERLSAAPSSEASAEQVVVNINKATASELESVRGIGPMLAGRIIEYRQANGRFERLEDLVQVPGIGQAKFEKIKSQLTL